MNNFYSQHKTMDLGEGFAFFRWFELIGGSTDMDIVCDYWTTPCQWCARHRWDNQGRKDGFT
jgi:hypothetical protein